jgi:hypothetical protein
MKKIIRNIFTHNKPKIIINLKINKNNYESYLNNYGKNNKNKTFYIIKREVGSGFFSNFFFVLNHLRIAEKYNFIPAVDMKNFKTIYNEISSKYKNKNIWDLFFEKNKFTLDEIYKSKNVIFSSNKLPSDTFLLDWNKNNLKKIFRKYFKIKKHIFLKKNKFIKNNFKRKIIGVHFRGTSYKNARSHSLQPNVKIMVTFLDKIIKKFKYKKIFLITEEQNYLDKLIAHFGNKIIYYKNSYRSYKDDSFKVYPRKSHRYQLAEDTFVEALILGECDGIVSNTTNIEKAARFFSRKKNVIHEIFLGLNSNNKYIARFLWHLKSLLPERLGGLRIIKYRTYVEKN